MPFDMKNKVALISGGASGIGLAHTKELLKNGLKGVTIADINIEYGKKALEDIESIFGPNRAIFVPTNVANKDSYEAAFKKTVEIFENVDILINNAGILNDAVWEKEIAINVNGTIHGTLIGLENYIPKYRSGPEGVIVNISSVAALEGAPPFPIYAATKAAVIGLSISFGCEKHYERTKVKVLTLCPGATDTVLLAEAANKTLSPDYQQIVGMDMQTPESVAQGLVNIVKNAKSGTVWVADCGQEPYEYVQTPWESLAPK